MNQLKTILISTITASTFVLAGCTAVDTTNTNTNSTNTATVNTTNTATTNSNTNNANEVVTNTKNNSTNNLDSDIDTSTWKEFTFTDLGFSILLPFAENNIGTSYTECDRQSGCDEYGYSYSASLNSVDDTYVIIRSVSKNWSPSRRAFFGEIYDLAIENDVYKVLLPGDKDFNIQPIDKFIDVDGVQVYLFDAYDYYNQTKVVIDGKVEFQEGAPEEQYAAVFRLSNSEKYKAAIITFKTKDLSLDELRAAIKSINFF